MVKEILNDMEKRCKNIYSDLSSLLFWKWDERFQLPLAEFMGKYSDKVHNIISREFDNKWDSKSISSAPKIIQDIAKALGGIRDNQILFTTNPESDVVLFSTWWPWDNNRNISLRISVGCREKAGISKTDLTMEIKKWFGINEP